MVTTLAVCPCSPHAAPGVCLAEGALIAVAGWDALVTGETLLQIDLLTPCNGRFDTALGRGRRLARQAHETKSQCERKQKIFHLTYL